MPQPALEVPAWTAPWCRNGAAVGRSSDLWTLLSSNLILLSPLLIAASRVFLDLVHKRDVRFHLPLLGSAGIAAARHLRLLQRTSFPFQATTCDCSTPTNTRYSITRALTTLYLVFCGLCDRSWHKRHANVLTLKQYLRNRVDSKVPPSCWYPSTMMSGDLYQPREVSVWRARDEPSSYAIKIRACVSSARCSGLSSTVRTPESIGAANPVNST